MTKPYDVIVIGGGASGLVAAYSAANAGAHTLLLEKQKRLGRKLSATGNGRCNLSHVGFSQENFHSEEIFFSHQVLERFDEKATLAFFDRLGVSPIYDDQGRYYPRSLQAGAVVDVLRFACAEAGVTIHTEEEVVSLQMRYPNYELVSNQGHYQAKAVVVACGGKAYTQLGADEGGYRLLEGFGHGRTALYPGIVQLDSSLKACKSLAGQKWDCHCQLWVDDQASPYHDLGEVLFTDYGLSGPPILQLSSPSIRAQAQGHKVALQLDLFPTLAEEDLIRLLQKRGEAFDQRSKVDSFIGFLPRIMATALLSHLGYQPLDKPAKDLSPKDWEKIAKTLKAWVFPITGHQGWKSAKVTLGGIATPDFNPASLESWLSPGLYACGEVLDVDGDCGGYNLQWAWSSGYVAGSEAGLFAIT